MVKQLGIVEYCKANDICRSKALYLRYSDLTAWYENIEGYSKDEDIGSFDCLLIKDQNCKFLILVKSTGTIYVYEVQNTYQPKKRNHP